MGRERRKLKRTGEEVTRKRKKVSPSSSTNIEEREVGFLSKGEVGLVLGWEEERVSLDSLSSLLLQVPL